MARGSAVRRGDRRQEAQPPVGPQGVRCPQPRSRLRSQGPTSGGQPGCWRASADGLRPHHQLGYPGLEFFHTLPGHGLLGLDRIEQRPHRHRPLPSGETCPQTPRSTSPQVSLSIETSRTPAATPTPRSPHSRAFSAPPPARPTTEHTASTTARSSSPPRSPLPHTSVQPRRARSRPAPPGRPQPRRTTRRPTSPRPDHRGRAHPHRHPRRPHHNDPHPGRANRPRPTLANTGANCSHPSASSAPGSAPCPYEPNGFNPPRPLPTSSPSTSATTMPVTSKAPSTGPAPAAGPALPEPQPRTGRSADPGPLGRGR